MIRRLDAQAADFAGALAALGAPEDDGDRSLGERVAQIIGAVKCEGDAALLRYSRQFDQVDVQSMGELRIAPEELQAALQRLPSTEAMALRAAEARITAFHEHQRERDWSFTDEYGNRLGQRIQALSRVGVYVPGGKASYPSSVLMNAVPARVAGVAEIVMVAPTPGGVRNDLVLAAAALAGISAVYCVGGAQAVAALAHGTESIPAVDKIVGPGNRYVAEAKRQVFGKVGIDMIAGPSEILVIADGSTDPEWVAMDLFSQAEHDESAQALLLSPDPRYLDAVEAAMRRRLPEMPRAAIIEASLRNRGALILTRDLEQAVQISNGLGPEHLELALADPEALLPGISTAGAIFLGSHSCEALGDYCAGPNHVLPTSGTARFSSPLGVYDFQRRSSIIHCSEHGAPPLARIAATLAAGESLQAHARSAALRDA